MMMPPVYDGTVTAYVRGLGPGLPPDLDLVLDDHAADRERTERTRRSDDPLRMLGSGVTITPAIGCGCARRSLA